MASGNEIKISIKSALDAAGIEATKRQIDQMSKSVSGSFADLAKANKTHMADIKAGWDLTCAAIQKTWTAITAGIKSAFKFETQTTQFKTLIGNIDEAKRHMKDLKELGDTPPFSLDQFAAASRQMMVMTDGALGYKRSLELVGDAAAATGVPIEQMGHAVGRLYAFIRDGQPLSRAVMELRNMGAITPEVAQKLQDLQNAGASNADIWAEVEKQLGRYNGAMAETEKTGEGMIGAIESRWDNVVRTFGTAFEEASKGGLQSLLDKMKELEQSGTLEVWAAKVAAAIQEAKEACDALYASLHKVGTDAQKDKFDKSRGSEGNFMTFMGNTWAGLGSVGAGIRGMFTGEGFGDAQLAYMALHGYGEEADKAARMLNESKRAKGEWLEDTDIRDEQAKVDAEIRAEAIAEKAAKTAEESARAEQEKSRITKQLAESQIKNFENDPKKRAEERKMSDYIDKQVHDMEVSDNKKKLSEATKSLTEARSEAAKAETEVKTAEERLRECIKKYNDNIAQNLTNEVVTSAAFNAAKTNGLQDGHSQFLRQVGKIGEAAGNWAVKKGLEEGKIRTVADFDKTFKQASKDARIEANRQAAKEGMDAQKAARLSKMSDKAMSKADKDWLDKWNKVNEANKAQKEAIQKAQQEAAAAKKRKEDAEKAMVDAAKKIESIDKRLQSLGLK